VPHPTTINTIASAIQASFSLFALTVTPPSSETQHVVESVPCGRLLPFRPR
jgi:hypothetical protein